MSQLDSTIGPSYGRDLFRAFEIYRHIGPNKALFYHCIASLDGSRVLVLDHSSSGFFESNDSTVRYARFGTLNPNIQEFSLSVETAIDAYHLANPKVK